ncbi:hypothetical protein [Ralstonia pseudosolanacearum]
MSEKDMQEEKKAVNIQAIRGKYHGQIDQDIGIYLSYGRTQGGIKGGVKKIMELLKIQNLSSIETKLNEMGGIDIVKLHFHPTAKMEAAPPIKQRKPI